MNITVIAKPRSKTNNVTLISSEQLDFDGNNGNMAVYRVEVKEPPINNRANEAILHVLAEYFHVPQTCVHLISGQKSRKKVCNIDMASSLT